MVHPLVAISAGAGSAVCIPMSQSLLRIRAACHGNFPRALRIQGGDAPAVFVALVEMALVKPVRPAAPELDARGHEPESRPVRRPLHRATLELALEFGHAG